MGPNGSKILQQIINKVYKKNVKAYDKIFSAFGGVASSLKTGGDSGDESAGDDDEDEEDREAR